MIRKVSVVIAIFTLFSPLFVSGQESRSEKIKTSFNNWFEKSTIAPNKHILSLLPSNNQNPLILQSQSAFLLQDTHLKAHTFFGKVDALYVNYQYTLKRNCFIEGGFRYVNYLNGYNGNRAMMLAGVIGYARTVYATYAFDVGTGFGVVVNNNLKLFNVHAGINLGIIDQKLGTYLSFQHSMPYLDGNENLGIFEISTIYTIKKKANVGFYLGLSKDIRITENLYLTGRFHNYFGSKEGFSEHVINYSLPTYNITEEVRGNLSLKGRMVALGLRWVF
jgi:hypothetical protein